MPGKDGGGNAPPDKELRKLAIPLPELRKPVQRAIREANQQFNDGKSPWDFGQNVVQPWNDQQNQGYTSGVNVASNLGNLLNPSANYVSRVGGGEFAGGGIGQAQINNLANGSWVGTGPGQQQLNNLAQGGFIGNGPGSGVINSIAQGGYVGKLPGQDMLNRFGSGDFMYNTPGQSSLNSLSEGRFVGNAPGQSTLNNLAGGSFVGKLPGQDFLNIAGSGRFVGNTPGQDTLSSIGAGQFSRPGVWAYDNLLDRSLGGSGGLGLIQGTAGGQYLQGNPHLDALIKSQSRDIKRDFGDATAMTEGRVSGAGRLGSNAEYELQGRNADSLGRSLADLETRTRYQDYGQERAYQNQAQLALPGAFQTEINTGLGAANARAGDEWQALQTRLAGAQSAGQMYQNSLGQALGAANNASQGVRADLGLQGQFANDAGNAYRADLGLQGQFAGQAGNMFQNAAGQALQGAQAAGAGVRADQGLQFNAAQAADQGWRADIGNQINAAQAAGQGFRADQNLNFNAANASADNYRAGINQALQGAGMAPGQAAAQFMGPDALMRYGGSAQQQQQAVAQEAQNRQRYAQEAEWQNLQRYIQSLQGAGGLSNPQAGGLGLQGQAGGGGLTQNLASLATIAGAGAFAFCDERLKADVERLGDLSTGAGLYRFRYLWDEPGTVRLGPMAQELAEVQPETVVNVGGVLMVDMGRWEV